MLGVVLRTSSVDAVLSSRSCAAFATSCQKSVHLPCEGGPLKYLAFFSKRGVAGILLFFSLAGNLEVQVQVQVQEGGRTQEQ